VLDLNGDGVKTLGISAGTRFDLFDQGYATHTGWVAPTDGLLVLDRNGDGQINSGGELFGSSTTLASGQRAVDGYQALAELDSNGDGWITHNDSRWTELRVWTDANSDGVSHAAELQSLDDLGITQLDLGARSVSLNDNGNWIGLESGYRTADGASHAMADVWFVADRTEAGSELQSQVSNLVQAISGYQGNLLAEALPASPLPVLTNASVATASVATLTEVLNRYDANGNPLAVAAPAQVAPGLPATPSAGLPDPMLQGLLSSGGKQS
jgi:hypothetical protein